jgi:hypothetical protein
LTSPEINGKESAITKQRGKWDNGPQVHGCSHHNKVIVWIILANTFMRAGSTCVKFMLFTGISLADKRNVSETGRLTFIDYLLIIGAVSGVPTICSG